MKRNHLHNRLLIWSIGNFSKNMRISNIAKYTVKSCFPGDNNLHTPNWHFCLTRHSETFPFSYMEFLLKKCSWKSKCFQFLRKKNSEGHKQELSTERIICSPSPIPLRHWGFADVTITSCMSCSDTCNQLLK